MAPGMTEALPPPAPARRKTAAKKADKPAGVPRPERARGGEAKRIADLVPAIGDTAFRKFGFVQSAIITRWPEIVGKRLARVTSPESLRFPQGKKSDGVLHVAVQGAHAPVVQHVIPDIIERVNRFFGYTAVARVRLSQAPQRPPAPPAVPVAPHPLPDPIEPARVAARPAIASLKAIADPELRAVLEGLAASLAKRDAVPKVS